MTAIERLLTIAESEVSYPEEESNAGNHNYTKYARNLFPGAEPDPWSDLFVDWCFVEAFGKQNAKALLCDYFEPFTTYSAEYYRTKGLYFDQPQIGDLIFLKKNERICHTGIVYDINSTMGIYR